MNHVLAIDSFIFHVCEFSDLVHRNQQTDI